MKREYISSEEILGIQYCNETDRIYSLEGTYHREIYRRP